MTDQGIAVWRFTTFSYRTSVWPHGRRGSIPRPGCTRRLIRPTMATASRIDQVIPQDVWTTWLVGPRSRPRLQPVTLWPRARSAGSGNRGGGVVGHQPRSTSTGWPSPRQAVASSGQAAARAATSSPARGGSGRSEARERWRSTAGTRTASIARNVPTRQVARRRPARRRIRLDRQGTMPPLMTADSRSRTCIDRRSPGRRPRPVGPCGRTLPAADGSVAVTHGQARTGDTLIRVDSRREPRKDAADTLAWPRNQR